MEFQPSSVRVAFGYLKKPNPTATKFYLLALHPKEGTIAYPQINNSFPCCQNNPSCLGFFPSVLSLHVHLLYLMFCLQRGVSNGI